jgi:hypothetical protein
MLPGLSSAFAQHVSDHPLRESADGFTFSYTPVYGGLQVTAQRSQQTATGVIEWVLGAGSQGQTPVIRVGETLFESRVSYFTRLNQFGITIGQPGGKSVDASAALGLRQSRHDATTCLECHSTGVSKDLEPIIPGVQCARCHAGSEEHANSEGKAPVVNPGKLPARDQIKVCGVCHRLTPPIDDLQIENVRFQPLRLSKSRCFTSEKLACTTCHPAHMDAKRNNAAFYDEKCNICHVSSAHVAEKHGQDCIGCHMPVVQLHPGLKFTDHFIRIITKR